MQEEELIVNFQQKNVKAFETIYQMYHNNILGVVFNIVRDSTIAEEVTQDIFIKAWNNASSYNPNKGRLFTWLLNIARNTSIDKVRSKDFKNNSKNLNDQIFVDIIGTHDNLNEKTDSIGIRSFVSQLADTCKKIIDLLYFKGYTQKEASESLNMPLGTIKTKNRNCINALREMVK
ncbi:RNA polymerase sigma factor [Tenacibaculum sp. IB213877]|uniref:RNA polymerase sigma factor n=1 Tax=Tenacibaculum sp. IB213877 TaxID=3097351 RepID=UPI002A59D162|nr:sigma-70 family RNA polymerase sigma factor [Tenacibaculum sp. IB213877]MDY0779778.1 sigma-70 family RNA polymerase sigma factor [Tenacibaculum sp. IB213877]